MILINRSKVSEFLDAVFLCQGSVCLCTDQGDSLNLKSELSKYMFAMLLTKPELLNNAWIDCEHSEDLQRLSVYLNARESD